MWVPNKKFSLLILIALILVAFCESYSQSDGLNVFEKELSESGEFTSEDFAYLEKGGLVIKKLSGKDKREVAVLGVLKLKADHDAVREAFERSITVQRKKEAKQYGRFKSPPAVSDMKALVIDDDEIMDLKACQLGNCDWNLSAEMIERIGSEIDWESQEAATKANMLMREMLVDYVGRYLKEGDSALLEYRDDKKPVNLSDEYASMVKGLFWTDSLVPSFGELIGKFPANELKATKQNVSWSKVKVALKPVLLLTHNIDFAGKTESGIIYTLKTSKQIYGNHYFDSSLAQTVMVTLPNEGGTEQSYLLFINRTRAGALGGRFGRLVRGIVNSQAESKLETVLKNTKRYTLIAVANRDVGTEPEEGNGIGAKLLTNPTVVLLAISFPILVLVAWLIVRAIKRKGVA